ncbi:MAG: SDR family oxidoreductase [Oliverpabstia sp.]
MYRIIRIEEPDFGCEGRMEGQAIMDTVILREESGQEIVKQMEDSLLYERDLNEGDAVMIEKNGNLRSVVAVITGGAAGIGKCICKEFEKLGVKVCTIDIAENPFFVGDIADEDTLHSFAGKVIGIHGHVDYLINNAPPLMKGIDSCSYKEFNRALRVGVSAPFLLTQLFMPYFTEGASIVNISSSRDRMSQPFTESYTAAKGGIAALTHALAVSLSGKVRVNSISPGWIDTEYKEYTGSDASQHPAGRVGNPQDIAQMVMYLCSEKAGFITGENICIDGGMTRQMIYHGDYGWKMN